MWEERPPFRNCLTKVSPVTEAVNAPTKGDKASTCGTMGHHTKEAYLKIEVNGRCYNCLLDTGSDVTIFPLAVVKGRKLHLTSTNLKAANGTSIPLLGETTINAVWHGKATILSGVVTEHMDEVVLGLTSLQEQGAIWDFKTGRLTITGESHLLLDGVDAAICRRLVVQEDVIVPARSQMDVPTKTVYSNLKATRDPDGASWITESGVTGRGLQVVRTLVPNLLTDVPVRVMNILDYPVTWEKGSVVSTLEPVDVIPSPVSDTGPAVDKSFKTELLTAVDEKLKAKEMRNLSQLIDEYNDVFSQGEYD